ncbi:YbaK/EbsC family protein [Vibrio paucivorans]
MIQLEHIYQKNICLFEQTSVPFQEWRHEPILDFATDVLVAERLGWTGTHSKSLFLKLKGTGYALYLTDKDTRFDAKALKTLLGKRPSICSDDEMIEQTGCVPGAVSPFALSSDIPIVVDTRLYTCQEILYTPGHPEVTFGFAGQALPTLLAEIDNPVIEM